MTSQRRLVDDPMQQIRQRQSVAMLIGLLLSIGCTGVARAKDTYAVTSDGAKIWYEALGEGVPIDR